MRPTIQVNSKDDTDIDRPTCRVCGSRMWLARVSPAAEGRELHTFECPVCEVSNGNSRDDRRGNGVTTPGRV